MTNRIIGAMALTHSAEQHPKRMAFTADKTTEIYKIKTPKTPQKAKRVKLYLKHFKVYIGMHFLTATKNSIPFKTLKIETSIHSFSSSKKRQIGCADFWETPPFFASQVEFLVGFKHNCFETPLHTEVSFERIDLNYVNV